MSKSVAVVTSVTRMPYIFNIIGQNIVNQSGSCGNYSGGSGD